MRTPAASATAVASLFPQGHVLVVPGIGHSVLTSDYSVCSQQVVRNWLVGGSVPARCPSVAPLLRPLAAFPSAPARPAAPRATLALVEKTIREAAAAWLQVAFAPRQVELAGLAGGTLTTSKSDNAFTLARYSLVPGIEVSGTLKASLTGLPLRIQGSIKVSGPAAAAGVVRVDGESISGTLSGRAVAVTS
jgi:hypothetical protein